MQSFIKNPDKVTVFLSEALFKSSALFMALRLGHYKKRAITLRDVVYRQKRKTNGDSVSLPVRYLWNSRSSAPDDASLAASSQRVHGSLSAAS